MADFTFLRDRMVAEQIEPRGVSDERVLQAMRQVPRERFVDPFPPPRAGQGPFINMQTEPTRSKRSKSKRKKR